MSIDMRPLKDSADDVDAERCTPRTETTERRPGRIYRPHRINILHIA